MNKTVTLSINECVDIQHLVRLELTATKTAKNNSLGDPINKIHLQGKIDRLVNIDNVLSNTEPMKTVTGDFPVVDLSDEGSDLIEAYEGYYEEVLEGTDDAANWVLRKILADSPKERVRIYCEWNGIINYYDRIYLYATSGIVAT